MSLGLRLAKRAQGRRAPHLVHARYHLTLHLRDAPRDARVRERALARGTLGLPLIAAAPGDLPAVGGSVQSAAVLQELRVAAAPRRGLRFTAIGFTADGLTGRTAQGLDIRLGDDEDLAAKLRVARSVLRRAGVGADYIDVSVPGAPVLRQSAGDPLTVNAPPPVAPALPTGADGDGGNWSSGASPAESIRTLFG